MSKIYKALKYNKRDFFILLSIEFLIVLGAIYLTKII